MTTAKYCSSCGKKLRVDSKGNKCYQCREWDSRVICRVCGCYCKSDKSRKLLLCSKHHSLVPAKAESPKPTETTKDKQLSLMEPETTLSDRLGKIGSELYSISHKVRALETMDNKIVNQIRELAEQL